MHSRITPIIALLVLTACSQESQQAAEEPLAEPVDYQGALSNPNRRAADHERDAGRKPAEVLAFFAIEPGMTVLDLFSGGRLLQRAALLCRRAGRPGRRAQQCGLPQLCRRRVQ